MGAKTDEALKAKAEKLFIHLGQTFKEIAAEIGRTEKTVSRWAEAEKWKEKKAAEESGPERLCQALLETNLAITDAARAEKRSLTAAEADTIYKNTKTINSYKKDVNVLTASAVFKRYNNWLVESNPDLAKDNTEYQRKFLTLLASE